MCASHWVTKIGHSSTIFQKISNSKQVQRSQWPVGKSTVTLNVRKINSASRLLEVKECQPQKKSQTWDDIPVFAILSAARYLWDGSAFYKKMNKALSGSGECGIKYWLRLITTSLRISWGVKLERRGLISPLWPASSLLEAKTSRLHFQLLELALT